MVHPYSQKLLAFLDYLHDAKSYSGVNALQKQVGQNLLGSRTIYRWHRKLGRELVYYPEISFCALGLATVHVFVEEASLVLLRFPYAVEACWLVPRLGERTLYLHCLVPMEHRDSVGQLLQWLREYGLCKSFSMVVTGDGRQALAGLQSSFTRDGHVKAPIAKEPSWTVEEGSESAKSSMVLNEYPFIVPVIFENYGARLSLNGVWRRISERLGKAVWEYFPRRLRKWPVNGKTYIKKAFLMLCQHGLFVQNKVVYRHFLDNALELFLLVRVDGPENLSTLVRSVASVSPVLQVYPAREGKAVLRLVGEAALVYKLFALFPEGQAENVTAYILDREETWKPTEVRFAWEILYDVKKRLWVFDREKLLNYMGVESHHG